MKRIVLFLLSCSFLISTLTACSDKGEMKAADFVVVATLFPQYDFAKAIVGDKGEVKLLLPPGADSHSFELTASDITLINKADLFIYTSPQMELWAGNLLDTLNKNVSILNLSENLDLLPSDGRSDHDHAHGDYDPHIWTSPKIAIVLLEDICDEICRLDPDNKDYYKDNYSRYLAELSKLDYEFKAISDDASTDTLYFSGKFAFLYLTEEYGFDYVAPFNGCSDLQVEDLASVANLVKEMETNGVKYIFYQEISSSTILDTIVDKTGATPLLLHSTHNITKDEFENGVTYLQLMKDNAVNIRKALCNG